MSAFGCRTSVLGRVSAVVAATGVALFIVGCVTYRWKPLPVTNLSLPKEKIAGRVVRLEFETGAVEMEISRVDFPYITGIALGGDGVVDFNLANATRIVLLNPDAPRAQRATVVAAESFRQNPDQLKSKRVRFETRNGDLVLRDISGVKDSWVTGRLAEADGEVRADLTNVSRVDIKEVDGSQTTLRSVGLTAGIVAGAVILVALLKTSCPFVYVDDGTGWRFVGEAYSGAAFRSTQRDDLLPLPVLRTDAGTVRVRLRNEAHETQYTDRAELVIVDHAPDIRALSTFDGSIILVGEAATPAFARDGRGRDVLGLVSAADERSWVTDPDSIAAVEDDRLEDHVTADFDPPLSGTPVLEMVAANTPWLDLVFGRFFAAMGDRLPVYLARGNAPDAGAGIQRWREREGVDLIVEVRSGDSWRRVAVVPTVGPAALREIAIPLPAAVAGSGPIHVRLRGGLGFWRIDRLALSARDGKPPAALQRLKPSSARASGGGDTLAAISATDGNYNALAEMNTSVEMTFAVPHHAGGLSRTAFLFTNGYYNVHTPVQAQWQPRTLKTIRDEPGALSRFGRDLARGYMSRQAAVTASAQPVR